MTRYALWRLAATLPTLLAMLALAFLVMRLAPGGPFDAEQRLPAAVRANIDRLYGLDRPPVEQFLRYLGGVARGDLGPSLRQRDTSVAELIGAGLPVSLTLGGLALGLALPLGIGAGVVAAQRPSGWIDRGIAVSTALALAMPAFVTGPLLALVFGLGLGWLPVAGWDFGEPRYLLLPVLTLLLPLGAALARLARAGLRESLAADWIRAARARGLSEPRILLHHALRPALLPVLGWLGPAAAWTLSGSLVVERVFGLPGTGSYLVQGALDRDYPLVLGMVLVFGGLTLLLTLFADLACAWLDPRLRFGH